MNTDSVDCTRLPHPFPHRQLKPGEFCWSPAEEGDEIRYLYLKFPGSNPSDGAGALRCFKGPDRGIEREWGWDGSEDKPTLQPSLLNPGEWHGYLKAGRLESCPA